MKILFIAVAFIAMPAISIYSQIKVLATGAVNIGKTGYERIVIDYSGYNGGGIVIYPSTGSNSAALLGKSGNGFMALHTTTVYYPSDVRLKENITSISAPLQTLKKLNGVKYDYKASMYMKDTINVSAPYKKYIDKSRKDNFGFIAQEVEKVLPQVVNHDDSTDLYSIDYIKIIPLLVEAVKDQQSQIDSLKKVISKSKVKTSMKEAVETTEETSTEVNTTQTNSIATLGQNAPNPSNQRTQINYYLPESVSQAILYIFDMNGLQIRTITINTKGNGSITLHASELNAGMYLYTLVADGKEVDTKRMILTK